MTDIVRQEIAATATTIVVKVGPRVLTSGTGSLNYERIGELAQELHDVMSTHRKVVLVSSGAVGAGMGRLGLRERPTELAQLQAVAAAGQSLLVEAYERSLQRHGRHAAQVLLTAEDLDHRKRYLNARNTLCALLEYGALPIINENDTVSVEELQTTFGDNDRLAAIVTNLLQAPLLVLLSDVEGLYEIPVSRARRSSRRWNGSARRRRASAMRSRASARGAWPASWRPPGWPPRLGECNHRQRPEAGYVAGDCGRRTGRNRLRHRDSWWPQKTLDRLHGAAAGPTDRRRRRAGRPSSGTAGACWRSALSASAATSKKGILWPFATWKGRNCTRLSNYGSDDVRRIRGLKTGEIAGILGYCPYGEVIHRDNLMVTASHED